MATKTTGWYALCTASIVSSTDTTATVRVYSYWKNNGWTYDINYVSSWAYCGSSSYQVMNSGTVTTTSSTTAQQSLGYKDFVITKTTAAQNISCYSKITSNSSYVSGTKTSSTVTVTVPAKTSYAVTYNANGGSGAPSKQTKWYGTTLKLSTTVPTREGYTFQGWATSASGSVAYAAGANYTANAAVTLYAVWKALTYTVTYNANGGSGAPSSQTKTYGVTLTLSSTKPTLTNYNFLGWGVSAGSTTVAYAAGASYTANASITLYAIWELAYTKPRIASLTVQRCNSSGTATELGTYARVKFDWATDKTASSAVISWGSSSKTVTLSGTSGSVDQTIGAGAFSVETSYVITIKVADANGSTTINRTLNGTIFPFDALAGGGGAAIGKPATTAGIVDVAWDIQDKYGGIIRNGLAAYGSSSNPIDPNTTLEELCLTNHTNGPEGSSGVFYFIHTVFYSSKSTTANRAQTAVPYSKTGSMYHRYCSGGTWSAWKRYLNADEMYPVGSIVIRYDHTSPSSLFGGTWTRIESRFLWGTPSTGTIGATAGEQTHTLTVSEMPAHKHSLIRPRWFGIEKDNADTTYSTFYSDASIYGPSTTAVDAYKTNADYYDGSTASGILNNGGGGAHNNMPPYINVALWRRTA